MILNNIFHTSRMTRFWPPAASTGASGIKMADHNHCPSCLYRRYSSFSFANPVDSSLLILEFTFLQRQKQKHVSFNQITLQHRKKIPSSFFPSFLVQELTQCKIDPHPIFFKQQSKVHRIVTVRWQNGFIGVLNNNRN